MLGLGTSSDVIVEQWNRIPFEHPSGRVPRSSTCGWSSPASAARAGFASHGRPDSRSRCPGRPPPENAKLAAEVADGAFTNFMPLSGAPRWSRRSAPRTRSWRAGSLPCRAPKRATRQREAAVRRYATVPVYSDFLRWLGRAEAIDPVVEAWTSGDRRRALELVPETLLRETFLFGPYEAQRERLAGFADAGSLRCRRPDGPPVRACLGIDAFAPG